VLAAGFLLITGVAVFSTPGTIPTGQQEIASAVRDTLSRRCFTCHGANGSAQKNVFVLDRERLIGSQIVVPGDAASLLIRMVDSDAMPPGGPPLTADEKLSLRNWVAAGAPQWTAEHTETRRTFLGEDKVLLFIVRDLHNQPQRSRQFVRYFSMAHLFNAGAPDDELESYRAALSKLINSLSLHKEITRPAPIDPDRTIFRVDLRDYNWTAASWDLLIAAYPYALESAEATLIAGLSGAPVPYIRADWFAARASMPPLYHSLLNLPRSLSDLERILGVDVARDLSEEKNVARAGVRASGVSQNNRVLERHASIYGAYWKSFDFRSSVDRQNIFQNPLSFRAEGSEVIFSLPNGLQAYMVVDGYGRRINEAPVDVVSDRTTPDDPVIRTGRSCMSCHYDGIRQFRDEARPVIRSMPSATFDRDKALALYPEQANLDLLIDRDRERFLAAVRAASGSVATSPRNEPITALARRFAADLSLAQAASEVGWEPARLQEMVSRSHDLASLGYSQLAVPGGAIKRDAFERNFDRLARGLGLGRIPYRHSVTNQINMEMHTEARVRTPVSGVTGTGTTPEAILRTAKTIHVSSMTMFLKPHQLENELRKRPEFEAMGLMIVKDRSKADLMIDLDRPVFTYIFTYSLSSADTRAVLTNGKVTAFDGHFAAPKIAKELLKRIRAIRGETPQAAKE
jgi:hypothetical protein